jgi:hypothetical protein
MKFRNTVLALAVTLGLAFTAHAQTTDFTLAAHNCGIYNSAQPYCYGEPFTATDEAQGSMWIDYRTTVYPPGYPLAGAYGFILFSGGEASLGQAKVLNIQPDGSLQFSGTDSTGTTYYGVLSYTFSTYRGCTSGRGATCRTYWTITGGTMSVERVDYAPIANSQIGYSPIAPTPVCIPTPPAKTCPSDW